MHLIGVSGVGMSAVARLLLERGFVVSGSDLEPSPFSAALSPLGARIYFGHARERVNSAQLVVVSTAIPENNPELLEARRLGIPVHHRAETLAKLMGGYRGIAVSGTHGKSTTTAMVGAVLDAAGLDPTVVVGAEVKSFQSNVRIGKGEFFVVEADESDGSFLHFSPNFAVITNVEIDHVDNFPTLNSLEESFSRFIERVCPGGFLLLNADCPVCRRLRNRARCKSLTFGLSRAADYQARNLVLERSEGLERAIWGYRFETIGFGRSLGRIALSVPGVHNVLNALAASALCCELGIDFDTVADALHRYEGLKRRFELVGKWEERNVTMIDDYAHHPTEVKAVLTAARQLFNGRLLAVFQPHRYTRTQAMWSEFGEAFDDADWVCITDVYAACEQPLPEVSGRLIADAVKSHNPKKAVVYEEKLDKIPELVLSQLQQGDTVLTLGAGDVYRTQTAIFSMIGKAGSTAVNPDKRQKGS